MSTVEIEFEPFVDADEIADFLRTSHRKVLALARAGVLPAHPVDPRSRRRDWRFLKSEVDRALHSEMRKAPSIATDEGYNRTRQPRTQKVS